MYSPLFYTLKLQAYFKDRADAVNSSESQSWPFLSSLLQHHWLVSVKTVLILLTVGYMLKVIFDSAIMASAILLKLGRKWSSRGNHKREL